MGTPLENIKKRSLMDATMLKQDYFQIARENEEVFRNILRDMKSNRKIRPGGNYIPKDLATELPLDQLFEQYSKGQRYGRFTILNFSRPNTETSSILFQDVAALSGGGAELEYLVKQDSSVEFVKAGMIWRS